MTLSKPCCPKCFKNDNVRTLSGGSFGKYRYICESCDQKWQQIPPHRMNDVKSCELTLSSSIKKNTGGYKCGKCGLPKKGHICSVANPEDSNDLAIQNLVTNAFKPATSALFLDDDKKYNNKQNEGIEADALKKEKNLPKMPFLGFDELDSYELPLPLPYTENKN